MPSATAFRSASSSTNSRRCSGAMSLAPPHGQFRPARPPAKRPISPATARRPMPPTGSASSAGLAERAAGCPRRMAARQAAAERANGRGAEGEPIVSAPGSTQPTAGGLRSLATAKRGKPPCAHAGPARTLRCGGARDAPNSCSAPPPRPASRLPRRGPSATSSTCCPCPAAPAQASSIDAAVQAMQQGLADALQHSRYPFARIYGDFRRERPQATHPGRYPLFDIAVTENPAAGVGPETGLRFAGIAAPEIGDVRYELRRQRTGAGPGAGSRGAARRRSRAHMVRQRRDLYRGHRRRLVRCPGRLDAVSGGNPIRRRQAVAAAASE